MLDGKNFETRYFGNKLVAPIENETPTILQVSASAYAAFRYMLDNPNEGFLFPEEVDDNKIVEYARSVLKEYVSFTCPKLERTFFKQNLHKKRKSGIIPDFLLWNKSGYMKTLNIVHIFFSTQQR